MFKDYVINASAMAILHSSLLIIQCNKGFRVRVCTKGSKRYYVQLLEQNYVWLGYSE